MGPPWLGWLVEIEDDDGQVHFDLVGTTFSEVNCTESTTSGKPMVFRLAKKDNTAGDLAGTFQLHRGQRGEPCAGISRMGPNATPPALAAF